MENDLYLGKTGDQRIADKYKEMCPKFIQLFKSYTNKALLSSWKIRDFNKNYFSDEEIANVFRFLLTKYDENYASLYNSRFGGLTKADVRHLCIDKEQQSVIMWFDLLKQFIEQNPQLKAAIQERKDYNGELKMWGLPSDIDYVKHDIMCACLRRKEAALDADPYNVQKKAAYEKAAKTMAAYVRYCDLKRANVIKTSITR